MVEAEHFRDRAAFVAALPDDDAERQAALAHAESCAECRSALARGARVVAMIEALPAPPPPSPQLLERVAAPILRELAGGVSVARPGVGVVLALAALVVFGVVVGVARHRSGAIEVYQQSLAVALVAAAVAFFAPHKARFALGAAVAVSGVFAAAVGASPGFEPAIGIRCMLEETFGAVLPLGAAYALARRGLIPRSALAFAAAAAGGALAAQAGLNATCPVHDGRAHLLVFHLGGVALAALLGALAGRGVGAKPALTAS